MDPVDYIRTSKPLSHAYLIRTSITETYERLKDFLKEKAGTNGSADLLYGLYENFGVDEARTIASFSFLKSLTGKKYIVVSSNSMTTEAQHALLKVVEDGVGQSVFFFILKPGIFVIPTLVSRCIVLTDTQEESSAKEEGSLFLDMSYRERLVRAEKFAKDHDREGARTLVKSLLLVAADKHFDAQKLRDLLQADEYLKLSGSSPKSVIGHLALVL